MIRSCSIGVLLLCATGVAALDRDRNEPIKIQADAAVVDEKTGVSTYTGNVTVNQGSLRIDAEEVQIHTQENEITQIVASVPETSPRLAHYEQIPENSELVEAEARTITYFVKDEKLHLVGEAQLTQTEDKSFAGEEIHYEVAKGLVKSVGRVESIFTPAKK